MMKTASIGKLKDEVAHSKYVTKDTILDMYDQMAALPTMDVPAPKDPDATYQVPDVSQWVTWLNLPPASPRVAHEDDRS
jgi:hypothetical protein